MSGSQFASNVRDEQWSIVEPLLPKAGRLGRRQRISLRAILDAIFYLLLPWRQLPEDFPVWYTVYWYFRSSTVLTIEEEAVIVAFREHTLPPLDDCLCRCGAPVKNLSHSASFHSMENNAPSKLGIKQLAS